MKTSLSPIRAFAVATGISLLATSAGSAPICAQMLQEAELDKKYKRLAPIHNDADTGWIFGSDQFKGGYELSSVEQSLMARIVQEFDARGTTFAMLIAPPRPVVAGQDIVDQTRADAFDVSAQSASFAEMVKQLRAAGVVMPDLQARAISDADIRSSYYFSRDTHWTNTGAAHSALALAEALDANASPAFDVNELPVVETFQERGSLADIVRATCDVDPQKEQAPVYDYTAFLPSVGGLLDDVDTENAVVLAGTSFSDRYKRDQYQSADAISAALGRPVKNVSVSGGGMLGPLEQYMLSGDYAAEQPSMIVWEFPYTYQLNEATLRQLLGALISDSSTSDIATIALDGGKAKQKMDNLPSLLGLRAIDGMPEKVSLKLRFPDGETTKLSLKRNRRVLEKTALDTWWVDLGELPKGPFTLEVSVKGGSKVTRMQVLGSQSGA
ncbi:alginate O-acetyltransferase AlgX-related protein [Shimia ponticola]|uniref:alginate O-acetyltransferase AlgX-related protein n=1 Tax=Shimia ponticola TaxID=2582893 RepID=UPI0011BED5EA|nr:hypothetical protein [Shimia ponticola]